MKWVKKLVVSACVLSGLLFWLALTPQQIAVNSAVFSGYSDQQLQQAHVYLIAALAGVAINPANILSNSAGFQSFSDRQLQEAQTYLLSQVTAAGLPANAAGALTNDGVGNIGWLAGIGGGGAGAGFPGTNVLMAWGSAQHTNNVSETLGGLIETNITGASVAICNGVVAATGPAGVNGAWQLFRSDGALMATSTNGSLWLLNPAPTNYIASLTLDMSGPSETFTNIAADQTYAGFTGISPTNFNTKLVHFLNSDSSVHVITPPSGVITNFVRCAVTNARTADLLVTIKPGVFTNWDWLCR